MDKSGPDTSIFRVLCCMTNLTLRATKMTAVQRAALWSLITTSGWTCWRSNELTKQLFLISRFSDRPFWLCSKQLQRMLHYGSSVIASFPASTSALSATPSQSARALTSKRLCTCSLPGSVFVASAVIVPYECVCYKAVHRCCSSLSLSTAKGLVPCLRSWHNKSCSPSYTTAPTGGSIELNITDGVWYISTLLC